MKRLVLLITGIFLLQTLPVAAEGIEFIHDWEEALEISTKENKPIFLDAYTTWCGPCKWMAANVMNQPEVGEFYNANFVNLKLDMEKGDGLKVAETYGVRAYPTLLFFNGEGKVLKRQAGALPVEPFMALGKTVLEQDEPQYVMEEKFASGKYDTDFLRKYLWAQYEAGGDYRTPLKEFEKKIKPKDLIKEENWKIFAPMFMGTVNEFFVYFEKNIDDFVDLYGEEAVMQKYHYNYLTSYQAVLMKEEYDKADRYVKVLEKMDDKMMKGQFYNLRYMELEQTKGSDVAFASLGKWLEAGEPIDWSMLNSLAWNIYEQEDATEADMARAMKAVEMSVGIERNYYNVDTYAMLMYKAGKVDRAIELAEEAIELAKESGDDYADTEAALNKMQAGEPLGMD